MKYKIVSWIFSRYRRSIYPKVNDLKGSTRLRDFLFSLAERGAESFSGESKDVFERGDWDNLIILDACRYDIYCDVVGECGKRITKASTSHEYLQENFSEGDFSDTVYVSANIFFTDQMMEKYIGRKDIFHEKFDTINTDWNEEIGVSLPEHVRRDAVTAENLFPEKRKIIHFLQPHRPFIRNNLEDKGDVYKLAELGKISQEEVISAYKDNLELVMEHVEELVEEFDGRTVITADHGELLGENGLYGHIAKSDAKALREVPWHLVESPKDLEFESQL